MTFPQAVVSCFTKFTSVEGRASRSEFWFFSLFIAALSALAAIIGLVLPPNGGPTIMGLVFIVCAVPLFSCFVRRLHDFGASGWRSLVMCVPIVHVLCIYWAMKPGDYQENDYGPLPE